MPDDDQKQAQPEEAAQEPQHEVERRERRAALDAHPHTQLRGILSDLASPAANSADINTKLAMTKASLARMVHVVMAHTPPPDDSEEKINEDFERQRKSAEGTDK